MRTGVEPVPVQVDSFSRTLTIDLLPALEQAFQKSPRAIRAVVVTNPHNPLGRCYPVEVLNACAQFCQQRDIHFISDELYAISSFSTRDSEKSAPFVSVLQLDTEALGVDVSRIHVIWSISKDFGASGLRLV